MLQKGAFLFLFIISAGILSAKSYTLQEAINQKIVNVAVLSEGGHSGKTLKLRLRNLTKKKFQIVVESGLIFHPFDSSYQDLINIATKILAFDKEQIRVSYLTALCIEASDLSPSKGHDFSIGDEAEDKLMDLICFVEKQRLQKEASVQNAIWCVTDGHSVTSISNQKLAIFTAELVDQPVPEYLVRNRYLPRPGQQAYQYRPVSVEGILKFSTQQAADYSFGIYNQGGQQVLTVFENQSLRSGHHQFKYMMEVRDKPQGKYYARIKSGENVMVEKVIEF